jgi:hypothetical protein
MHLRAAAATHRALENESPYSIGETVEKVKTAVSAANMHLIRVQMRNQDQSGSGSCCWLDPCCGDRGTSDGAHHPAGSGP